MTVLVGGVGQLYQGDLDLGRLATERLASEPLGPDVLVEELHYGGVAVVQRLQELGARGLVLIGAVARGRAPGSVHRRRIRATALPPERVQQSVRDAVTGYVTIDLLVEVAAGFDALPGRTVAIEVEPAHIEPAETITPQAAEGMEQALGLVRTEVGRIPLLELVDELGERAGDTDRQGGSPALDTVRELLGELRLLDDEGRWGAAFMLRDRLRLRIADGETGNGMDHLDWCLWWGLIEELDRLQAAEART